eukprot:scaffold39095_cov48-Attheya_sp.AAC.1
MYWPIRDHRNAVVKAGFRLFRREHLSVCISYIIGPTEVVVSNRRFQKSSCAAELVDVKPVWGHNPAR